MRIGRTSVGRGTSCEALKTGFWKLDSGVENRKHVQSSSSQCMHRITYIRWAENMNYRIPTSCGLGKAVLVIRVTSSGVF
jgi:hypothetical protein